MELYRITFKPLEPYTFGTDLGASFAGVKATGYESYIMTSNKMPEQTTILGTLRYMVLRAKGQLKTDFDYGDRKDKITELIGESSFSFTKAEKQEFGLIKSISPVFIWNSKDKEIYIRNPLCNVEKKKGYKPMELEAEAVKTSKGMLHSPVSGDKGYNAKDGFVGGFIGIEGKKRVKDDDIFTSFVIPGNYNDKQDQNKNKDEKRAEAGISPEKQSSDKDRDDGFFKREVNTMKDDYSFGIYAVAGKNAFGASPNNGRHKQIVFMGRKNASFEADIEMIKEVEADKEGYAGQYLKAQVEDAFPAKDYPGDPWYCALSDLYPNEKFDFEGLALIYDKHIRSLETNIAEGTYSKKRARSERFNLISAGSCFYKEGPKIDMQDNCINAGYNIIVRIGGNE